MLGLHRRKPPFPCWRLRPTFRPDQFSWGLSVSVAPLTMAWMVRVPFELELEDLIEYSYSKYSTVPQVLPDWHISYGALDLSNAYAAVYTVTLPRATQVVDRFHLIRLANAALDEVRRRVQRESHGRRGRKDDPLYKSRKLLVMRGSELDDKTTARLESLLSLGDSGAEVTLAYRLKEALTEFYEMGSGANSQTLSNCEMTLESGAGLRRWNAING